MSPSIISIEENAASLAKPTLSTTKESTITSPFVAVKLTFVKGILAALSTAIPAAGVSDAKVTVNVPVLWVAPGGNVALGLVTSAPAVYPVPSVPLIS